MSKPDRRAPLDEPSPLSDGQPDERTTSEPDTGAGFPRLRAAIEVLAAHSTGAGSATAFLQTCVEQLCRAYDAAYAFVGTFSDDSRRAIETRAVWTPDGPGADFEYPLAGTPCADVLEQCIELVERDLRTLYPGDMMAVEMGLESYLGAPLLKSTGEPIGIVAVGHTAAMEPPPWAQSVIRLFATRMASELERERANAELSLAASVFDASLQGIVITDPEGVILRANPAATLITGYAVEELVGQNSSLLRSGLQEDGFYDAVAAQLETTGTWHGELSNRRKDGEVYPQWTSITSVRGDEDTIAHYIAVFSDISQQKLAERHIQHLAHYDPLTDLPNRRLFRQRLEDAISDALVDDRHVALLYLDLDRFKPINDSLGHAAGDELLRVVAQRLARSVRATDTVARLGGDEFTMTLVDLPDAHTAVATASRIAQQAIHSVRQPILLHGHEVAVTVSVGLALWPQDADTAERIVMAADTAMYHAKRSGRNDYRFYASQMNATAKARLILEGRLRGAVERGEFALHYQPRVDVVTNEIVGYEALLRWCPEGRDGSVRPPAEFIELLEESGQILEVGQWVVAQACRQLRIWHNAGRTGLRMAINLSPRQFQAIDLADRLRVAIGHSGVDASLVELELTESVLLGDQGHVMRTLHEIKKLGVSIAIDDFGTGYSSLSYLKRLPIDTLKVDRCFVSGIPDDTDDMAITTAIVALAQSMKLSVVAEGVETDEQLEVLKLLGCDEYQGFLFARPAPA